jgi:hypothetical protein
MRISEALSEAVDVGVPFANGVILNVTYRPMSYTIAELDKLAAEAVREEGESDEAFKERRKKSTERVIDMLQNILVAWDLTDNDEVVIDFMNREEMRTKVPLNVYTGILNAVRKAQSSGEAERPSAAI